MLGTAVAMGLPSGVETSRRDVSTIVPDPRPLAPAGVSPLQWAQWALFTLACGLGAYISMAGVQMLR
jgi:hypothetical protein